VYTIAIVILNYKGWQDTLECVESLQSQEYSKYRIIIVDNHSENGSVEKFRAWANGEINQKSDYFLHTPRASKKNFIEYDIKVALQGGNNESETELSKFPLHESIVIINNDENLGFSGGNNVGAIYAEKNQYDYILLLNNDTVIIDRDFLTKLIAPFQQDDNIYAVGPKIINFDSTFDGPYIEDSFVDELFYSTVLNYFRRRLNCPSIYIDVNAISSPRPISVYKISGACMIFKTTHLKEIGYLDENVWLSCEEAIISEKVKIRKGKVVFQPLTTLIHKKAQSPRPKVDRFNILQNHYRQREYFNRTYKGYGDGKIIIINFFNQIRLLLTKIKE